MKGMWEWIIGGGGLVAMFAAIWRSNVENEHKINRVYKRLDEYKDGSKNDFVAKDVCKVIHEQQKVQYGEIKEALNRLAGKIDRLVSK